MRERTSTFAATLVLGLAFGAGTTSLVNAVHHVKLTELHKADRP